MQEQQSTLVPLKSFIGILKLGENSDYSQVIMFNSPWGRRLFGFAQRVYGNDTGYTTCPETTAEARGWH